MITPVIDYLKNVDTEILLLINGDYPPFLDYLMYWISKKLVWIPFYILLFLLLLRMYKKHALIILLAAGLMITLSDQLTSHFFKNLFLRPRPCHDPALAGMLHLVNNECGGLYGFVSSHAGNSFALAAFLSLLIQGKIRFFTPFLFSWATLISFSRIYLGVHYPGDVLAGALVGSGLAIMVFVIYRRMITKLPLSWQPPGYVR